MERKVTVLLVPIALCALTLLPAGAQSISVETTVAQPAPRQVINLKNFDLDQNGMMSTAEVSEMLFRIYDTSLDGTLDNTEYAAKAALTVAPIENVTLISYDFNNDGIPERTDYEHTAFLQDTMLARFDAAGEGLSPEEFLSMGQAIADSDGDGKVDLGEWQNAYMAKLAPALFAPAAGP
jgi:hypothetical protein